MSPVPLRGPGKPVQVGPSLRVPVKVHSAVELSTASETHDFGVRLAGRLRPGDLVILSGPLGAGKTTLAQGIGAGLGVVERMTSPTFVLARVHRSGRVPLVHVDAYRLHSMAEVDDLDLDVDLEDSVTLVEWGRGMVEQLSEDYLVVHLDRESAADDQTRRLLLEPHGPGWSGRLG